MTNRLAAILAHKQQEITALYTLIKDIPDHSIAKILGGETIYRPPKNFKQTLRSSSLNVIAEIKRRSPSNGALATITDPVILANTYVSGNASAISVLTEEKYFHGSLTDLIQVANALQVTNIPILRKDFILDEIQIAESRYAGADAILCIVAALGNKTKTLLDFARLLQLDVLVEVIDRDELALAVASGAEIIAVNNRNLKTFAVDVDQSMRLVTDIPKHIIKVAASGITRPSIAQQYFQAGFDAVLIGEALVRSNDPAHFIQECRHG